MANNLGSNVTRQVARVFLEAFDAARVISKAVDTQLLSGKFSPRSGSTVDFKRPHDYTTYRNATGDLTSYTKPDIISGKATGTVQDFFSSSTEWDSVEEALELDQLDDVIAPMATRICQDLESDFAQYCIQNGGIQYAASGTYGTAVTTWGDIASAAAHMKSLGVPTDKQWSYIMNPHTTVTLANLQNALASGSPSLVDNAWEKSMISRNFAGFQVLESTHLYGFTSATTGDLVGAVDGAPTLTYVGAKDTMTQVITVDAFGTYAGGVDALKGQAVEIAAVSGALNQLSLSTRSAIVNSAGANQLWRGNIVSNTAFTSGAGTITVTGPALYEANGGYNTVSQAIADNDVITILGADTTFYQPNLVLHPQAFGLGTVKLPKLYSTDTVATTKDGMSIRVSKYSDGDTNKQKIRFDLLPAYSVFNPWFGGQAWG